MGKKVSAMVYETHCSSPLLTSVTLLGLQHTAVVVRAGSNSREKYSFPTRCRSSIVTLETAWSNHLCVCVRAPTSCSIQS